MPKAAGMQLLLQIRNSPGQPAFQGHGLLTTTRHGERAVSTNELGNLSINRALIRQNRNREKRRQHLILLNDFWSLLKIRGSTGLSRLARRGNQALSTAPPLEDCHGCRDQELVLGGDLISWDMSNRPWPLKSSFAA
jgi:hypothetical protein